MSLKKKNKWASALIGETITNGNLLQSFLACMALMTYIILPCCLTLVIASVGIKLLVTIKF